MKKLAIIFLLMTLVGNATLAQPKSPSQFFGRETGSRFTSHYQLINYLDYLQSVSKIIRVQQYGKTYEDRELMLAFISSEENISRLEEIRKNNLQLSGQVSGKPDLNQPALVWLSYNVHGNEAASTEAALYTIHYLLNPQNTDAAAWLKKTVVIIDPNLNPDGRERYINFFNSVKSITPDPYPFSREHLEPWPGGRTNHYYFDLNRDWAWQTQIETQQRLEVYSKWLPHIHVDFHEQGINEPYYFAPAAEPVHQDVTSWQRDFQTTIGKNNARHFDKNNWLYFTKERFDLLYPSYGDTYPTYNGAIGMTYEQGGSGKAGTAVMNREGVILTLRDRILHHHTSAIATIESVSLHAGKIVAEFSNYFRISQTKPSGQYKSYIVKGENPEKLKALIEFLNRNGIKFGYGQPKMAKGFNYFSGKDERFSIENQDIVISAYQPKSVLLKVLFEPSTFVSDSATYDITAWAVPYAYGLKTYAIKEKVRPITKTITTEPLAEDPSQRTLAFAANWNSIADVRFLTALLNQNIRVRYSEVPFNIGGKSLNPGSLIITRTGNENLEGDFDRRISEIAREEGAVLYAIRSGLTDNGPDLGSAKIRFMKKPKILVLSGDESSPAAFGEIWHFFEQQIHFPISAINTSHLPAINLHDFNVLIIPDGNYRNLPTEKLISWINDGGKLIAMQSALSELAGKKGFNLQAKETEKAKIRDTLPEVISYADRERDLIKRSIPGAVFKVKLDNTHPLGFGYPNFYFSLKLDDKLYNFLSKGWNVGTIGQNSYVSGLVGPETKSKLQNGLLLGVQESGSGSIIYMADNPLFRGFWENGKLLFSNAIFMVGQ